MMIPRDTLKRLAAIQSEKETAISFYFKPETPQNLTHQAEHIVVKDKIRELLGSLNEMRKSEVGPDLQRILAASEELKGNSSRIRAICACKEHGLWWEMDLDDNPNLRQTYLHVGRHFDLVPLLAAVQDGERSCIMVLDREKTRVFLMHGNGISEHSWVIDEDEEWKVRNTGAKRSSHAERSKEDSVLLHFKFVADHLQHFHDRKDFDLFLIGTRNDLWAEIEPKLHPSLKQVLVGRFHADPNVITIQEVQRHAGKMLNEHRSAQTQKLLQWIEGESQRNGLVAVGAKSVLEAMERGEVGTLLLNGANLGSAARCNGCGHMSLNGVAQCEICNGGISKYESACECLVRQALANEHMEVRVLPENAQLLALGGIAAQLLFRSHQSKAQRMAG
jgi:peptide subunit release factor 1 (eRF1)